MAVSDADLEQIINRYYTANGLQILTRPNSQFFKEVAKNPNHFGEVRAPMLFSDGGGQSATLSTAQSTTTATQQSSFEYKEADLTKDYAVTRIENLTMLSADKGHVANLAQTQMDAKLRKLIRAANLSMYASDRTRALTGAIVSVTTNASTVTLTFSNAYEVQRFTKGDSVVAATSAAAATAKAASVVHSVNAPAKKLVLAGTGLAVASGDVLFLEGSRGNGVAGIPLYIPVTPADSTPLFGVDRSLDVTKLQGHRYNATGDSTLREALIKLASTVYSGTQGEANITRCSMPVDIFTNLIVELEGTHNRGQVNVNGFDEEFGYSYADAVFGQYRVRCYADPENNTGNVYMLDMDSWQLMSRGPIPHFYSTDGKRIQTVHNDDKVEIRAMAYYQLACLNPYHNGVAYNLPS